MLRFSFPLGRWMGVDLRLHLSFVLLLGAAIAYGEVYESAMRGFGLFLALAFAVAVREIARAIAAAYVGLRLRALFLLPVGGVMAFAAQESSAPTTALPLVLAAPLANFVVGLLLLGISYGAAPGISLFAQPWISPLHVLRSFVWMQFLIAVVNLLPAATMPTRHLLKLKPVATPANSPRTAAPTSSSPAFSWISGVSVAVLLAGVVLANVYLVMLGVFGLLGSQLQSQMAVDTGTPPESMRVEEVMLTEFTTLSSSDTLQGALARTVHSLHEVFPVLRGDRLVGSVTRQTLAEKLQSEGDGYVQGVMSRRLQVVGPKEELLPALRRAGAYGASEFIPVAEDGRLLGILAPQSLSRAVSQVNQARIPLRAKVQE